MSLGIIAGTGELPQILSRKYPQAPVAWFYGQDIGYEPKIAKSFYVERLSEVFDWFHQKEVTQLCLVGAVHRPRLRFWRLNRASFQMMKTLRHAFHSTDGTALKILRVLIENQGFSIIGVHELIPDLLVKKSDERLYGNVQFENLPHAVAAFQVMAKEDRGQALVMRKGGVFLEEGKEHTSYMLKMAAQRGEGGYLFKTSKPHQDLDIDMASIGSQTILQLAEAKMHGLVVEEGRVLMIDRDEVHRLLMKTGISLKVLPQGSVR